MQPRQLRAIALAVTTLFLSGCYNLLIVNVGVANKNAAALAAPIDPQAYCAALTQQGFTLTGDRGSAKGDPAKLCEQIIAEQIKVKK